MKVLHYQRKQRASGNFSLEFIFADIRRRLASQVEIEVREAPFYSNGFVPRIKIVADAWRAQAEIIHVTGDINFASLGIDKRSCVLTILDCGFLTGKQGLARLVLKKLWLDWPVQHAGVVTTISEFVKSEIVSLTQCPPSKIKVIPVPISEQFRPNVKPFNTSCPRILVVGTAPNKNLGRVIESCRIFHCQLIILGKLDQPQLDLLRRSKQVFENHCNLNIEKTIDLYNSCDIVCFPSTYEGFGMPILEGNAVGRPVLTGDCSAMPEVAGDAACLVDPCSVASIRDGLNRIIGDASYRRQLVEAGFSNVKRFEPDRIAQAYLETYQLIALGSPSRED